MSETRLVPLKLIRDNPWRDRMRNPIDPNRVEAIATSIEKTSKYWLGTYGRETEDGHVELAFGHHRYEAAKAQGLKEIPITIEKFTDGEMLVWMAQENVRGELPVVLEAVAAAVRALGEGKIEIQAPGKNTPKENLRYAPSFLTKSNTTPTVGVVAYTMDSIAQYLGFIKKSTNRAKNSVVAAMGILERAEIANLEEGKEGAKKAVEIEKSFSKMKVNEALQAISEIKQREEKVKQFREKDAAEIAEMNEQQRQLKEKIKEREAKERKEHEELLRKRVAARLEENKAEAEKITKRLKEKEAAAEAKAVTDKVKMAALDTDIAAKKAAAEAQHKKDVYAPCKRDTDRLIHILERRDLFEELKALSRKPLTPEDRERVRRAALDLGTWYGETVAPMFLPPITSRKTKERK